MSRVPRVPHAAVILAALSFAGLVPPAMAGTAAPDFSAGLGTSAAVSPDSAAARSPELDALRRKLHGHQVRLWADQDVYECRRVSLDRRGVGFDGDDLEGAPASYLRELDSGHMPSTRIDWSRIERIDATRSSTMVGLLAGCLLAGACALAIERTCRSETSAYACMGTIPLSVGLGTIVGALSPHWECVWRRPAASQGDGR